MKDYDERVGIMLGKSISAKYFISILHQCDVMK